MPTSIRSALLVEAGQMSELMHNSSAVKEEASANQIRVKGD
jgi:hypothetical protein